MTNVSDKQSPKQCPPLPEQTMPKGTVLEACNSRAGEQGAWKATLRWPLFAKIVIRSWRTGTPCNFHSGVLKLLFRVFRRQREKVDRGGGGKNRRDRSCERSVVVARACESGSRECGAVMGRFRWSRYTDS